MILSEEKLRSDDHSIDVLNIFKAKTQSGLIKKKLRYLSILHEIRNKQRESCIFINYPYVKCEETYIDSFNTKRVESHDGAY